MKFTIKKSTVKMMVKVIDKVSFSIMALAASTALMFIMTSLFVDWIHLQRNLTMCLITIVICGIIQAILHPQEFKNFIG